MEVGAKILMEGADGGMMWLHLLGPKDNRNVQLKFPVNLPDNGMVTVHDSEDTAQAGMYVDGDNNGVVFADVKSFRVPHPKMPGKDIWYACPEGPEAAAYIRGTARLIHGRAEVTYPEHYAAVASGPGVTVQVTPLSAASKGLAVVEKRADGFVARELMNGTGTYDFDYTVMAVRTAHEDFRVIRPAGEGRPAQRIGRRAADDDLDNGSGVPDEHASLRDRRPRHTSEPNRSRVRTKTLASCEAMGEKR